jgi:hypothetical protein
MDAIVSADKYMVNEDGDYRFDVGRISECHERCFATFAMCLHSPIELGVEAIIVDNTNTTLWEVSPYVLAAGAAAYNRASLPFRCNVIVAQVNSLAGDAFSRNVHGVPMLQIDRMSRRFELPMPYWNNIHGSSTEVAAELLRLRAA